MLAESIEPGYLILEDGQVFEGVRPKWQVGQFPAEVVFTTGMCGYVESLTDPSFAGQILTFTFPLIGNYGVGVPTSWESGKIQVAGIIINESCSHWHHHAGCRSLREWLLTERIPFLTAVDTRSLTKSLRTRGTMRGVLSDTPAVAKKCFGASDRFLVSRVSLKEKRLYPSLAALKAPKRVIAVDCGMKENLVRSLLRYPIELIRVPYDYDYSQEDFDGIFLSNGPGDPIDCQATIQILHKVLKRKKPVFGVCLGAQMLALAAGAKTFKLPFGHRGQNQPCVDVQSGKCYMTAQNHGYAVDAASLPEGWEVTFKNLNDGSVEGIQHKEAPFYAVQFHPEAAPGPTDTRWFFERFWKCL